MTELLQPDGKLQMPRQSDARLTSRLEQFMTRHESLCLAVAVTVFAANAAYQAITTPLWFDEFFTFFISRLSSLSEMFKAMPVDGQPPLQCLLTHISIGVFGQSEFAIRLPGLLGYIGAGLLTYKIIRTHGTVAQALFGTVLLLGAPKGTASGIFGAPTMARPYPLLLFWTALVYLCWQTATATVRRRQLALCGLSIGIAAAILTHHFGVIHVGIPLGVGETVRLFRRRRLDKGIVAATVLGLVPLGFTVSLAERSRLIIGAPILRSVNFWAKPSIFDLFGYVNMVALPLVILVLLFAANPVEGADEWSTGLREVPGYEWAAAAGLCLLLPLLLALTWLSTGVFLGRYAEGTSLGLALIGSWGLPRLQVFWRSGQRVLAQAAVTYIFIVAVIVLAQQTRVPVWNTDTGRGVVSPLLSGAPSDLPIVVSNAFDYAPIYWYASPTLKNRLTYLSDTQYAEQQSDFIPELSLVLDRAYVPLPLSDYHDFTAMHSSFLLFRSGLARLNWVDKRLKGDGWKLTLIGASQSSALYHVERISNDAGRMNR